MTVPTHHPGDALLMDYAGGSLGEAGSVVVATHLALCPACRRAVGDMEAVGGALLATLGPTPVSPDARQAMLARLDGLRAPAAPPPMPAPAGGPLFPQPLRGYVGEDPDRLRWWPFLPGLRSAALPVGRGGTARLIRAKGGVALPRHSHDGLELVIVLEGGLSDSVGHFVRGDVAVSDESVNHRPVADPEGCLCLSVNTGRLHLTGLLGRFFNRFLRL